MSFTLILVAAASFLIYQMVRYVEAALFEEGNRKYVWHNPILVIFLLVIAAFVGGVVALLSQDQAVGGNLGLSPWPLDYSEKSAKEWIRAIILGFGAMPILKSGSLKGMAKGTTQNTPIGTRDIGFRDHIRLWWRSM